MNIKEVKGDLFTMPREYALAHCISADFALGAGIAKEFNKRFNCQRELFEMFTMSWTAKWDATLELYRGGCIPIGVFNNNRTPVIFNLITKRNYWDKPTLQTLANALTLMKFECSHYGIRKIAMPRIGCGLDKLKWADVKPLIENVFEDTDIEIIVCSL